MLRRKIERMKFEVACRQLKANFERSGLNSRAQSELIENREGLKTAQYELQMVKDELITSRGELRESREELRAANDDLNDKITQLEAARCEASEARALLEVAHCEASEAVNSAERLNEECRGLRWDLHQQVTLVAQRDEVIGNLGIKPVLSGPLGGSLFSRRPFAYTQTWTSTSTFQVTRRQRNLFPRIILKNRLLLLRATPPCHHLFLPLMPKFLYSSLPALCQLLYFSFMYALFLLLGLGPETYVALLLINIHCFFFLRSYWGIFAFLYESYGLN